MFSDGTEPAHPARNMQISKAIPAHNEMHNTGFIVHAGNRSLE